MKKTLLIILFLSNALFSFSQKKDDKAILNFFYPKAADISPEGNITIYNDNLTIYKSDTNQSNWTKEVSNLDIDYLKTFSFSQIDDINFFNKDTAIYTGYLKNDKSSICYLTFDGGKTLKYVQLPKEEWIYTVKLFKNGKVWIGGSSSCIHFSEDYGQTWKEIANSNDPFLRVHSIEMLNNEIGYWGSSDKLFKTTDNWKTYKEINLSKTNIDGDDIDNIILWKKYIFIQINSKYYYADTVNYRWKKVKSHCNRLLVNENQLYGFNLINQMVKFDDKLKTKLISNKIFEYRIPSIIFNKSKIYFILSDKIGKIENNKYSQDFLYTKEIEIPQPHIVYTGQKNIWGATKTELYIKNINNKWKRLTYLKSEIFNLIKEINDSTILFRDENSQYFTYSIKSEKTEIYEPKLIINDFLKHKIKSLNINTVNNSSFYEVENESKITWNYYNDTLFSCKNLTTDSINQNLTLLNNNDLYNSLNQININYQFISSLKDFNIKESEITEFYNNCEKNKYLNSKKDNYFKKTPKLIKKDFFKVLTIKDYTGKSFSQIYIEIINTNGDTLFVSPKFGICNSIWGLPWVFNLKNNITFDVNNLEFSKAVNQFLPSNNDFKYIFSNKELFIESARRLWELKESDEDSE